MLSLYQVVKINFFSGLLGALISAPFLYFYEFFQSSPLAKFDGTDAVMIIVAPLLTGFAFAASGVLAFPFIRFLQSRSVIRNVL